MLLRPENEVMIRNMSPEEVLRYAAVELRDHPPLGIVCEKLDRVDEDPDKEADEGAMEQALSHIKDAQNSLRQAEAALE